MTGPRLKLPMVVHMLIGAGVGAVVVARAWDASQLGEASHWWAAAGTVVTAALTVMAMPIVWRATPTLVPWLVICACAATYACVPETDQIPRVALVSAAAFGLHVLTSLIGFPVHWILHVGVAGSVLWSGIFGATARQSALIGALFAWWPMVLLLFVAHRLPATQRKWRDLGDTRRRAAGRATVVWWTVAAIGALATAAVARTGALQPTITPALISVAVATPISVALTMLVLRRMRSTDRSTARP